MTYLRFCKPCLVWGAEEACWCCGAYMPTARQSPRWSGMHEAVRVKAGKIHGCEFDEGVERL